MPCSFCLTLDGTTWDCLQMKREVAGCGLGGDWAVRITAKPAEQPYDAGEGIHVQKRVSLIFYMMDEAVSPLQYLFFTDAEAQLESPCRP